MPHLNAWWKKHPDLWVPALHGLARRIHAVVAAGRRSRSGELPLAPPLCPARHHPLLLLELVESQIQSRQRNATCPRLGPAA